MTRNKLLIISLIYLIAILSILSTGCKKDDDDDVSGLKDVDGNKYTTVTIGSQVWMAENLKTTKFNDGTAIQNSTNAAGWKNLTTPAFCWYNNDKNNYGDVYGALYNGYAVSKGNLCPAGWRVPSDEDWQQLELFLGMDTANLKVEGGRGTNEGGKLKEAGLDHWSYPNKDATNSSKFTALPGGLLGFGYPVTDHKFTNALKYGLWWSSTTKDSKELYSRKLFYDVGYIERFPQDITFGLSVRCIKE